MLVASGEAFAKLGISVNTTATGLEVSSISLALPWRVRAGRVPGTAVRFEERLWEVVDRRRAAEGDRFELRLWPDGEAIRHGACLDVATIERLAAERIAMEKRHREYVTLRLLLPFIGLLPARLLDRWDQEHGMLAHRAVIASTVLELAFAVLCVLV